MAPLRTGDGFANVVVTAVASTTSVAPDAEKTWQLLLEGRSGIRELDMPFVSAFKSPVRIGGPLHHRRHGKAVVPIFINRGAPLRYTLLAPITADLALEAASSRYEAVRFRRP